MTTLEGTGRGETQLLTSPYRADLTTRRSSARARARARAHHVLDGHLEESSKLKTERSNPQGVLLGPPVGSDSSQELKAESRGGSLSTRNLPQRI